MDVLAWSTSPGANIEQYGCNNGANQAWSIEFLSNGNLKFRNKNSGLCMDAPLNGSDNIVQHNCHTGSNQNFQLIDQGEGKFALRVEANSKCVEVENRQLGDGINVRQWDCDSSDAQQFSFDPPITIAQ